MDFLLILTYFVIFSVVCYCVYIYVSEDSFQLKCIISTVDGNKYCVRERNKIEEAADLLARVTKKLEKLVKYAKNTYPDDPVSKQIEKNFNSTKIMETLPTSELTAFSLNKGEQISFCLNEDKHDNDSLISEDVLTFVALHELSHLGTESIGHKDDFWVNFKKILIWSEECNIYKPEDFSKTPKNYCGMKINDSPYFSL